MIEIPFNKPSLTGKEIEYIAEAVELGHISGDGPFTRRCEAFLQEALGVPRVLLTTSCTHALEMAAMLLDLQPGDEVIIPSFTFVSTVNAFVLRGARPIFTDIRPDTLNLDEAQLERAITPRTRAIVPVHYAGVGCEMDTICDLASAHAVPVIEDNAHALFARYRGRHLGTFGALATQSFHETKNIICGEGGALLVNDERFAERAEILREKGTNRSQFFRGQVDKYTWVDIGSSYVPSDILAAFLYAQLLARDDVMDRRRQVFERYAQAFEGWAGQRGIGLPVVPPYCEQSYHMFYMIMPSLEARSLLIEGLKARGILSVFHYVPLHLSRMGEAFGYQPNDFPVTEEKSERLVRLPFYTDLSADDQNRVIEAIFELVP